MLLLNKILILHAVVTGNIQMSPAGKYSQSGGRKAWRETEDWGAVLRALGAQRSQGGSRHLTPAKAPHPLRMTLV